MCRLFFSYNNKSHHVINYKQFIQHRKNNICDPDHWQCACVILSVVITSHSNSTHTEASRCFKSTIIWLRSARPSRLTSESSCVCWKCSHDSIRSADITWAAAALGGSKPGKLPMSVCLWLRQAAQLFNAVCQRQTVTMATGWEITFVCAVCACSHERHPSRSLIGHWRSEAGSHSPVMPQRPCTSTLTLFMSIFACSLSSTPARLPSIS